MFLGVVFYSFVVGSLTTIMTTDNKAKELLIKQLAALDQFKDEVDLDVTVYDGIYNFLINNHEEVFAVMDEGAMINNLPNNYKEELFYFQYGNLIEKLIFLKELPIELTWALVENLKKVQYNKGDVIFEKNELSDSIYFIFKGKINIIAENGFSIQTHHEGETVGDIEMYHNLRRICKAVAHIDPSDKKTEQVKVFTL